VAIEVADAEVGDLAALTQAMERLERFAEPCPAAPMQQVEIDALDSQPLQAALAGGNGSGARGVVGIDLAHDEGPPGQSPDAFTNDLFGATLAIHLGGVDHGVAELQPVLHSVELLGAPAGAFAHAPRAEPQYGHGSPGRKFA